MRVLRTLTAALACACAVNGTATASPAYRLDRTRGSFDSLAVAGGRVFWAVNDGEVLKVFSSLPAGDRRRVYRLGDLSGYDDVSADLRASQARVAMQAYTYYTDPDEEYYGTAARVSGAAGGRRLAELPEAAVGYERLQDVDGDRVLTTAERRVHGRWTFRVFMRDLAGAPAPAAVTSRARMARQEYGDELSARISGPWVAVLRLSRRPRVTVYAWATGRPEWTVRLPAWHERRSPYSRALEWDLARDGTVAVALALRDSGPRGRRQALGWARPRGRYVRLTGAVRVQPPFQLAGRTLTYARAEGRRAWRLSVRPLSGMPRALTGRLGEDTRVATDGRVLAVTRWAKRGGACLFAAVLPVARSQQWPCD